MCLRLEKRGGLELWTWNFRRLQVCFTRFDGASAALQKAGIGVTGVMIPERWGTEENIRPVNMKLYIMSLRLHLQRCSK